MKKIIILALVVLMCGIIQAHDPNSLPPEKAWRITVNSAGIATMDFRLSPEQLHVWKQGGIRTIKIAESVQRAIVRDVKTFWNLLWQRKRWQDRK